MKTKVVESEYLCGFQTKTVGSAEDRYCSSVRYYQSTGNRKVNSNQDNFHCSGSVIDRIRHPSDYGPGFRMMDLVLSEQN